MASSVSRQSLAYSSREEPFRRNWYKSSDRSRIASEIQIPCDFQSLFLFLLFFCFCCSDWPSAGLACSLKNFQESVIETGIFDHGVAMCGGRKFCSEFFAQLFEHFCAHLRLHKADHADLGIIGKIFSSCRSWLKMMPILVKSDDVRSARKTKARHGRLWPAWESTSTPYAKSNGDRTQIFFVCEAVHCFFPTWSLTQLPTQFLEFYWFRMSWIRNFLTTNGKGYDNSRLSDDIHRDSRQIHDKWLRFTCPSCT